MFKKIINLFKRKKKEEEEEEGIEEAIEKIPKLNSVYVRLDIYPEDVVVDTRDGELMVVIAPYESKGRFIKYFYLNDEDKDENKNDHIWLYPDDEAYVYALTINAFNYCFKLHERKSKYLKKDEKFTIIPPILTKNVRFKIV